MIFFHERLVIRISTLSAMWPQISYIIFLNLSPHLEKKSIGVDNLSGILQVKSINICDFKINGLEVANNF
jgi:hypothetical protein